MREPSSVLSGEARARLHLHLFDLQRLLLVHRGVEEVDNVRAHEGLRNAIAGEVIGRDDMIGARSDQVLLGLFFAGARNDVELRIQAARGEDDVDVGGVGGSGGDQSARAIDVQLAQNMRLGRVASQGEPAFGGVARQLCLVGIDDDKRQRLARQLARARCGRRVLRRR